MNKSDAKRKIKVADAEEVAKYGGGEGDGGAVDAEAGIDAAEAEATAKVAGVQPGEERAEEKPGDETAEVRAKVEELTDKHLRAVAELQNYRRRAAAEQSESLRYASADLIRSLLPVVDDLERSLATVADGDSSRLSGGLGQGVRLVYQNLVRALEAHHVERIEAVGQPFDPALHEAMRQQPSQEHPPGTVLEEYQAGYRLWDRVLRPSKVVVSQGVETPQEERTPEGEATGAQPAGGNRPSPATAEPPAAGADPRARRGN